MSDLYFLERMMTERVRQIERDAQLRRRLGDCRQKTDSVSVRLQRMLGTWLIRAGQRLQERVNAFNRTAARPIAGTSPPTSGG